VRLQQFVYNVIHRKGSEHQAPDTLSRSPLAYDGEGVDLIEVVEESPDKGYNTMVVQVKSKPESYPAWKAGRQLFKAVKINKEEINWTRVIPRDLRPKVLVECHDHPFAGHLGEQKTFNRVRQRYYWPKMRVDVKNYVS